MKFIFTILAVVASVNAIALKDSPKQPGKPDNWTEDWGYKFDDKHYPENTVKGKFTDNFGTVPRGDNPNCSSC